MYNKGCRRIVIDQRVSGEGGHWRAWLFHYIILYLRGYNNTDKYIVLKFDISCKAERIVLKGSQPFRPSDPQL